MARYAEWNKFIANLKTDKYGDTDVVEVGIAFQKATADVVPKSDVEKQKLEIWRLEGEIERLKRICHSYALQYGTVKDQQAVIDKAKADVAREIFEEIDKSIDKDIEQYEKWKFTASLEFDKERYRWCDYQLTNLKDYKQRLAELKKKYTEASDD